MSAIANGASKFRWSNQALLPKRCEPAAAASVRQTGSNDAAPSPAQSRAQYANVAASTRGCDFKSASTASSGRMRQESGNANSATPTLLR